MTTQRFKARADSHPACQCASFRRRHASTCSHDFTLALVATAELRSVRDRLAHDPPELAALTAQLEATIAQLVSHAKQYVWLEHVLYLPTPPASQSDGAKQGESSVDEGVHCSTSTGTVDADSACCDKGLSGSDEWFDSRLFNPKGRTLRPVHVSPPGLRTICVSRSLPPLSPVAFLSLLSNLCLAASLCVCAATRSQ
eukprot:3040218-Pleurochrysis_carterae.AAC.2